MELVILRRAVAYILLTTFVLSTSAGFFMYEGWMGFVALGVTSGIAAFLLGSDEGAA